MFRLQSTRLKRIFTLAEGTKRSVRLWDCGERSRYLLEELGQSKSYKAPIWVLTETPRVAHKVETAADHKQTPSSLHRKKPPRAPFLASNALAFESAAIGGVRSGTLTMREGAENVPEDEKNSKKGPALFPEPFF